MSSAPTLLVPLEGVALSILHGHAPVVLVDLSAPQAGEVLARHLNADAALDLLQPWLLLNGVAKEALQLPGHRAHLGQALWLQVHGALWAR